MVRRNMTRAGILIVLVGASVLSCGERTPTEPDLNSRLIAVPASERFESSPQHESRELLVDGRATDIEWNVAGDPTVVLLKGSEGGGGGDYFISLRATWSYSALTSDSVALYLLAQWPDPTEDRLEQPLVTTVDWQNAAGGSLIDCNTNDALLRPENWTRSPIHEDQIVVEIFSDVNGSYPADRWRWGAGTTDPITPVNGTEFLGAVTDGDTFGSDTHPAAGLAEDFYNDGSGWVRDAASPTAHPYMLEENFAPGSYVPLTVADKGSRDTRLNRGKPVAYSIWRYVARTLIVCDSLNPVRVDDSSLRDKTWNPEDITPSYRIGFPDSANEYSQADVLARSSYDTGKWALELRRLLEPRKPDLNGVRSQPRPDDVVLVPGHTYGLRVTVYDASKTRGSASAIIPLYIRPRN